MSRNSEDELRRILISTDCNLGQNVCRLFHILAQFFSTTSKTELNYYYQKVNLRVASWVADRIKAYLKKLGNFKKIPKMLQFDGEHPTSHPRGKF